MDVENLPHRAGAEIGALTHQHRMRAEILERNFAHMLDSGGMRRVWLRGRENVWKRYLIHACAFNLSLVMRNLSRAGTPRGLEALKRLLFRLFLPLIAPFPLTFFSTIQSHLNQFIQVHYPQRIFKAGGFSGIFQHNEAQWAGRDHHLRPGG